MTPIEFHQQQEQILKQQDNERKRMPLICSRHTTADSRVDAASSSPFIQLIKVCEEFIRKVESGEARSVRTYNDMKAALAAVKAVPSTSNF